VVVHQQRVLRQEVALLLLQGLPLAARQLEQLLEQERPLLVLLLEPRLPLEELVGQQALQQVVALLVIILVNVLALPEPYHRP